MLIRYLNRNEKFLRIFGDIFVENNQNKCKIMYKNKDQDLKSVILIEENNFNEFIDIELIIYKEITNLSGMFNRCSSITLLPDISKWNTSYVTNMFKIFCECSFLSFLFIFIIFTRYFQMDYK